MLCFSEDYFQDELRDGFLVSETMKRSWAAHLKILDKLKELMDKYNLTYYAEVGTALGAYRHKGFVPWDDDIDISLFRKDYMVLMEHADELGDDLCIRSVYNSDTYMNFHAVATHKVDILEWDEERMKNYYGCPFICYVDIYPLDFVPRDVKERQIFYELYYFAYKQLYDLREIEDCYFGGRLCSIKELRDFIKSGNDGVNKAKKLFEGLNDLMVYMRNHTPKSVSFDEEKKLRHQLCMCVESVAQMYDEKNSDEVGYCPIIPTSGTIALRKLDWYRDGMELDFECTKMRVAKECDLMLASHYGADYMHPLKMVSSHKYPYFRTEVSVLIGGDTGDIYSPGIYSEELISDQWRSILFREDGTKKKITIIGLSATDILNRGKLGITMLRDYFEELENRSGDDIGFVLAPGSIADFMDRCGLDLKTEYLQLVEELATKERIIFDDQPDSQELEIVMSVADNYYGDECRLADLCKERGIPVTIIGY